MLATFQPHLNSLLEIYLSNKNWIDLTKDIIFLLGVLTFFPSMWAVIQYLRAKRFNEVSKKIQYNLNFRERFEPLLREHILSYGDNPRDIAVRLVLWKNYPWNLSNDEYKFYLHINYLKNKPWYGWIDNTSLYFHEWPAYLGSSIYIDKYGIYFFADKGNKYKNFQELPDCYYVFQLPFHSIVNFDFIEKIEHEPVIYIKKPYTSKSIYGDSILIVSRNEKEYFRLELSAKNKISKSSIFKYSYLYIKHTLNHTFDKVKVLLTKFRITNTFNSQS